MCVNMRFENIGAQIKEMNEMALPSRHGIRNSILGGLRPNTLDLHVPLGQRGFQ